MQRVRVGLTGLAFVFVLVMLATAFLRMARSTESGGNTAPVATNSTAPNEPLAQLGVAPGNPPAPAPAPEPAPAKANPAKPAAPTQ